MSEYTKAKRPQDHAGEPLTTDEILDLVGEDKEADRYVRALLNQDLPETDREQFGSAQ